MYWDEKIETMPREELRLLQSKMLSDTIHRVYEKVPNFAEKIKKTQFTSL